MGHRHRPAGHRDGRQPVLDQHPVAGGGIWGYGGVSVDSSTGHVYAASSDTATNLGGDEGYTPYAGSLLALGPNLNLLGWYQPTQPPNYTCGSAPPCDQDFAATPLIFQPTGCPPMLAAGLTWTLAARANGQYGTAEVWTATATAALSGATVTSTETSKGYHQSLTVTSFEGATGIGSTATAGAGSGAPTVGLVTTGADSLVFAVGEDWDRAIARTVGAAQALDAQRVDTSVGETFWVQQRTQPVTAPAPVTLNDTAPTADRWDLAAVEVTGT